MSHRTKRPAERLNNRATVAVVCGNTHQIVHVGLCQAYELGAQKLPGRSVPPWSVQAKVATFALDDDTVPADAHGVAYSRQTIRQSGHLFVGENEGLGSASPNGAEFHQWLIVACRVESDRHVLGLVFIDEKHAS